MLDLQWRAVERAVRFQVKVQPGAGQNAIVGLWQSSLKVKVASKAQGGEANLACLKLLARQLDVAQGKVTLIQGATSSRKLVQVLGLAPEEVRTRLLAGLATT